MNETLDPETSIHEALEGSGAKDRFLSFLGFLTASVATASLLFVFEALRPRSDFAEPVFSACYLLGYIFLCLAVRKQASGWIYPALSLTLLLACVSAVFWVTIEGGGLWIPFAGFAGIGWLGCALLRKSMLTPGRRKQWNDFAFHTR